MAFSRSSVVASSWLLCIIVMVVVAVAAAAAAVDGNGDGDGDGNTVAADSFDGWVQEEVSRYQPADHISLPLPLPLPPHFDDTNFSQILKDAQTKKKKKKKAVADAFHLFPKRALAAAAAAAAASTATATANVTTNPPTVIVVAKDGSGKFRTVQSAINSVPVLNSKRVIIYVKNGIYNEKIVIPSGKNFITLKGQSAAGTYLQWSDTAYALDKNGQPLGTYASASVAIEANDFIATDISFKNTARHPPAGAVNRQAVALRVQGDKVAFYNCSFYGAQGTLYDKEGRHYYSDCYIEGSIDVIFGDARSLFFRCKIHSIAATYGSISAQKRLSAASNTGYSFVSCSVTGSGSIYLGRAWGAYSRIVFAYTKLANIIRPQGWEDFGVPASQKTVFYGEYKCTGLGSNRKGRVSWSRSLTDLQAKPYLSITFIDGQKWLPK